MEQTPSSSMFAAFEAKEFGERVIGPQGEVIHAEVSIGDSVVMITEGVELGQSRLCHAGTWSPQSWPPTGKTLTKPGTARLAPALNYLPLEDHFYGERGGRLRDPFGQQWMLSQRFRRQRYRSID